jgi:hypothetical protein
MSPVVVWEAISNASGGRGLPNDLITRWEKKAPVVIISNEMI